MDVAPCGNTKHLNVYIMIQTGDNAVALLRSRLMRHFASRPNMTIDNVC